MIIKAIRKIEDCLESTNVRDIILDGYITKKFIDYLGLMGKLYYNDEFLKPYFKVIVKGRYTVKGAQGNKTLRIMLPETETSNDYLNPLIEHIQKYEK
jgi:hypothetical protein